MTPGRPNLSPEGAEFFRKVLADEPIDDPELDAERDYWDYWSGHGATWERQEAQELEAQREAELEAGA